MKRILLFSAGYIALAFTACTEKELVLDFTKVTDSTYTAAPESPAAKKVLVEEYTGVRCVNCPAGAEILDTLMVKYPGKVLVISNHSGAQTQPLPESKYNFNTDDGRTLMTNYFAEDPPKPTACIDRKKDISEGTYFVSRQKWISLVEGRLTQSSPVNLSITSQYDAGTRIATVKVKCAYTQNVTKKQNLTIVITENGIVDAQEYPTYIEEDYDHEHVLRDIVSPVTGQTILKDFTTKQAGRIYVGTIYVKISSDWNADNCHVVAFVHNDEGADREVVQAEEISIK